MVEVDAVSVSFGVPRGVFTFAHDDPKLRAAVVRIPVGGFRRPWQCQIIYGELGSGSTMSYHWTRHGALAEVARVFEGHEIAVRDKLRVTWIAARLRSK